MKLTAIEAQQLIQKHISDGIPVNGQIAVRLFTIAKMDIPLNLVHVKVCSAVEEAFQAVT